eukprot:scaffold7166_cov140-Isochrysis_galbana.AAC.5
MRPGRASALMHGIWRCSRCRWNLRTATTKKMGREHVSTDGEVAAAMRGMRYDVWGREVVSVAAWQGARARGEVVGGVTIGSQLGGHGCRCVRDKDRRCRCVS